MNTLLLAAAVVNVGVVLLGAIPAVLYPIRLRLTPWRDTATGRALMTKAVAVAALYLVGVCSVVWFALNLPLEYFSLLQAPVNTFVTFAVTYQYVTFERRHRAAA